MSNALGIASFVFGLISIFFLAPVFVPLSLLLVIIAIIKKQLAWGIIWIVCGIIGFVTSPILLGIFRLATIGVNIEREMTSTQNRPSQYNPPTQAYTPPPQTYKQVDTQATGGGVRVTYKVNLGQNEVLVGHADKFQGYAPCVAYIVVGPGNFEFWIQSGIWYKWINTTPELNKTLLQEQKGILINKYNYVPVQIRRLP